MHRTNIYLDDGQLTALKHLAAEEGQSVAALVRTAVEDYLSKRLQDRRAWQQRFNSLLDRVHQQLPQGIAPEEIEKDVSLARQEVRQQRSRARRR